MSHFSSPRRHQIIRWPLYLPSALPGNLVGRSGEDLGPFHATWQAKRDGFLLKFSVESEARDTCHTHTHTHTHTRTHAHAHAHTHTQRSSLWASLSTSLQFLSLLMPLLNPDLYPKRVSRTFKPDYLPLSTLYFHPQFLFSSKRLSCSFCLVGTSHKSHTKFSLSKA